MQSQLITAVTLMLIRSNLESETSLTLHLFIHVNNPLAVLTCETRPLLDWFDTTPLSNIAHHEQTEAIGAD